jgi:hypothetical protein
MSLPGWKRLLDGWPWFRGAGRFPLPGYSEVIPPPRLVRKPYGTPDPPLPAEDDPWGWPVTEYEEALELRPGLRRIAAKLFDLFTGADPGRFGLATEGNVEAANDYWPPEVARHGPPPQERFVTLLPLALSRTQDDVTHVVWTLFGVSEQGPERPFWRGFFAEPGVERPAHEALAFVRRLLHAAYGEAADAPDLVRLGFRILSDEEGLPSWAGPFLWSGGRSLRGVRYLLTFRPFPRLPAAVRKAYLGGELHLLPYPGSLVFWGSAAYRRLAKDLPFAVQLPLLHLLERYEGPHGIRVPQAGWVQEPAPGQERSADPHGLARGTYKRTHSHAARGEDALANAREDHLSQVLFCTDPHVLSLYDKPQARNAQIWTADFRRLLDGPAAGLDDVRRAAAAFAEGGRFGYAFRFPPMQVGRHALYWHRPLVAYRSPTGRPELLPDPPLGYLTAYRADEPDPAQPVELWPRLLRREAQSAAVRLFAPTQAADDTLRNVRKLLDAQELLGVPLPPTFARRLLTVPQAETLDGWLQGLPERAAVHDREAMHRLCEELRARVGNPPASPRRAARAAALTFARTARRSFEVEFWKTIGVLSDGAFVNKNNGDVCTDPATLAHCRHPHRDLEALGDYLLGRHARAIADAGLAGKALVGETPFRWRTQFPYPWLGGWAANQAGTAHERNLMVVIPGRDRGRAVVMADHYDTAFMSDRYHRSQGGFGARLATPGADDNCSATATLLLAAPVLLGLSRQGRLGCDVWLVHLTGEEFPGDGIGARHLCQSLVEGTLRLRLPGGAERDLSGVRVQGAFVLDMVAHNRQTRDVFQIGVGAGQEAMRLARLAHEATEGWNACVPGWNRRPARRGRPRGRRGGRRGLPPAAPHPTLTGEVRPHYDPRSTVYNADSQEFSDVGVPVVLLMEDYDIARHGYHDSHDTLANISLDYGAALAAIAIESVARAAMEEI